MIDGIIKGDGTSRKIKATLPATYEEFKQAAGAGEQTLDVMFNAPGWQQQPTFLNKQNLGQDKTMAVYNRGPEGTVDDLFQSVFAVGDIKVSTRTDLGNHWLLCNGDIIEKNEYPELVELFPNDGGTMTQVSSREYYPPKGYEATYKLVLDNYLYFIKNGGYSNKYAYKAVQFPESEVALREFPRQFYFPRMKKFGDKYAVYEANSADDLMVSDSLDGPWKSKKITVDSNTYWSMGESLHYVNGYYIVFMQNKLPDSVPNTDKRAIAYTTDIESGDWKIFKPGAFKNKRMMRAIGFMQGKWVIFGQDFSRNEAPIVSVSENADITSFGDTYRDLNIKVVEECVSIKDKIYASNGRMYVMKSPGEDMIVISNEITSASTTVCTDGNYIFSGNVITDTENEVAYEMKNASGGSSYSGYGDGFYVWDGSNVSYISRDDAIATYLPEISVQNAHAYIRGK